MYEFIRGKLVHAETVKVILEAHGVGYALQIPVNIYGQLPHPGVEVILYTSFVVRELSQTLYGFLSPGERDLFEILLDISGIGPKLALSLCGHLTVYEMQQALLIHDSTIFNRVPGVGKKTAERLLIELKGKLEGILPPTPTQLAVPLSDPRAQQIHDAMSALISLGYSQQIAQRAVKKTLVDQPDTLILGELITHALKNI